MKTHAGRQRRGLTAVAVLVCLVVIAIISGALFKIGLAQRAQVRDQERRVQAEWLAQSGLERALARLAEKSDYAGESWEIPATEIGREEKGGEKPSRAAVVLIQVERAGSASGRRRVKVQADYPPDPPGRVRRSMQVEVELSTLKTGASR
jgi:hypothetical protein